MNNIFRTLGLTKDNGLYITTENKWYGLFPKRIEEFFESKNAPDAFFCIENKPFILFYENRQNQNDIFRNVWNFNESPVVFIIESDSIEIYNGYKYLKEKTLSKIENSTKDDFNYLDLVSGKTWSKFQSEFDYKNRVDYNLLENIKAARHELVIKCRTSKSLANRLIGKCIFTRYLIDRKVRINYDNKFEYLTNDDFAKILKDENQTKLFFIYLQNKFNGDLFHIEESEYNFNRNALTILQHLISGSTIQDDFIQTSLFDIYDFSIIPVEFISNVYELFIGEDKQAEKGAYYTPVFLVDYILSQTVEKYFKDHPDKFNCKILDPACGSGVFLVEAYRKIIKQYEKNNPSIKKNKEKYKEALIRLAKDNIFGIDKDPNAIPVAAFSIYLTMLHYQSPPDIENFKFPHLTETNFFTGDFFDPKFEQNDRLKNIDFIIGNPPWKRGQGIEENPLYLQYINKRKKEEKSNLGISNKEIAQAFLLRTSDFSNNTKCALIVTSKVLYNLQGEKFRKYFLDNYFIDKILELAAVRKVVFSNSHDPAIAPAAIIFYRYAHKKNTDENILEHIALKPNRIFSMFKVFSIQKNDYKRVIQKRLKKYDYLWKVLVYGNYLDFNFIKRLKDEYQSVDDIISDKRFILEGTGIQFSNHEIEDSSHLIGLKLIDIDAVESFYINFEKTVTFTKKRVHRRRDQNLFKAPVLLIKKGVNTNTLKSICAISNDDLVFKDSLTGIKVLGNTNRDCLSNISSILQSSMFSYYAVLTASSLGIEREQMFNKEKFSFPYINNEKFSDTVSKIEKLKQSYYKEAKSILSSKLNELQEEIDKSIKKLDKEVLKSFDLSEEEQALVDYAVNITIPLIMKHRGYEGKVFSTIKIDSDILKKYAEIFFDRFESTLNKIKLSLSVEIWHNDNIIGLFFNETSKTGKTTEKFKFKKDLSTDIFLRKISSLGIDKITDRLFIQKDIRGFEENGFYIIKPNEKRLWHKAIAYLDMYEFADAILEAGREEANV